MSCWNNDSGSDDGVMVQGLTENCQLFFWDSDPGCHVSCSGNGLKSDSGMS